jgi:hypothetical protein
MECERFRWDARDEMHHWLETSDTIRVLNVAGPRASDDPRIYEKTRALILGSLRPR